MQLPLHSPESAPAESRALLDGISADLGVVPNLAATAATSAALLQGFDALRRAVASTKLDPVLREVAGLATGVAVDNRYGVAFHSTMLTGLGVNAAEITAMRAGGAPSSSPAATAVYALAREAALQRGRVTRAVTDAVVAAGLTTEEVLEVLLEVAFASLVGLVDGLAEGVELDGFLAAQRWP